MELGLSLGDRPAAKPFFLAGKAGGGGGKSEGLGLELGFCMGFGRREEEESNDEERRRESTEEMEDEEEEDDDDGKECYGDPPVQLELLPFSPVPRHLPPPPYLLAQLGLPWQPEHGNSGGSNRRLDVNMMPSGEEMDEPAMMSCSPNSAVSSFQMDFSTYRTAGAGGVDGLERAEAERASSRASDEEENGLTRKKLRLSKEQSAYLEESFKEHNTLNPKQKLALAKQLNLRPRQVEVWFQNRRARTKLKQTEVDCEYLKRCCEKLTEENRRLQKELQELRTLKTTHPFYMHLPATTLTICPSCERVATANTNPKPNPSGHSPAPEHANLTTNEANPNPSGFPSRPRFHPFGSQQQQKMATSRHQPSAAS